MKLPGTLDGIIVAFLISLGAVLAGLLLGGFVPRPTLSVILLSGASLCYLVFLLRRARARVGRIVAGGAWAILCLVGWMLQLPLFEQILLQAVFIWLVRSLYFHGSVFAALLDFGLIAVGLAAGAWAIVNTASFAAALWSFFLVQALAGWIPALARAQVGKPVGGETSSFQSAHRIALDAVRKLSQP